ncbi:hypothetical protein D3P08_13345 [Paenibacillus nanensis]|uniref:Uncharacterized protein n=1 Tax=Paenibacillus nanensis TaxID=393251 RepID=A0A3A1V1M9_9BACL|nr:hypothetical protein D3P08_13345 [Paenibacillus nanensis]
MKASGTIHMAAFPKLTDRLREVYVCAWDDGERTFVSSEFTWKRICPWRKMAEDGLTTWMEDTVSQRSDAMHGDPCRSIYEYAAAIQSIIPRIRLSFRSSSVRAETKTSDI